MSPATDATVDWEVTKMARFAFSFIGNVAGAVIKWALIAVLWCSSILFVTTSALALDAISDALSGFKGIPTPYLDQKGKIKNQQGTIKKQQDTIEKQKGKIKKQGSTINKQKGTIKQVKAGMNKQKVAVKKHSTKVNRFAGKMAGRNVADAGTSLIPIAGGLMSVTFAVADVYAACELITMQNELEKALRIDGELSDMQSVCVGSVNEVDRLAIKAEEELDEFSSKISDMPDLSLPQIPDINMPDIPDMPTYDEIKQRLSTYW
ncbi:hypothetical protein N9L74_04030 [Luminiphilus sp.]|nr:hypothetical protein [Luminiphilus sp.]